MNFLHHNERIFPNFKEFNKYDQEYKSKNGKLYFPLKYLLEKTWKKIFEQFNTDIQLMEKGPNNISNKETSKQLNLDDIKKLFKENKNNINEIIDADIAKIKSHLLRNIQKENNEEEESFNNFLILTDKLFCDKIFENIFGEIELDKFILFIKNNDFHSFLKDVLKLYLIVFSKKFDDLIISEKELIINLDYKNGEKFLLKKNEFEEKLININWYKEKFRYFNCNETYKNDKILIIFLLKIYKKLAIKINLNRCPEIMKKRSYFMVKINKRIINRKSIYLQKKISFLKDKEIIKFPDFAYEIFLEDIEQNKFSLIKSTRYINNKYEVSQDEILNLIRNEYTHIFKRIRLLEEKMKDSFESIKNKNITFCTYYKILHLYEIYDVLKIYASKNRNANINQNSNVPSQVEIKTKYDLYLKNYDKKNFEYLEEPNKNGVMDHPPKDFFFPVSLEETIIQYLEIEIKKSFF